MELKLINLEPRLYRSWDKFCEESDDAWFWHTSDWLEYNLNYQPKMRPEVKSFLVVDNKRVVAVCPLILVEIDGVKEFSLSGVHGPMPAFSNDLPKKAKNKIMKLIFSQIDNLAGQSGVKRVKFNFSVLSKSFIETAELKFNFSEKFGYLNNNLNALVIDLKRPLDQLWKEVSHGHQADISRSAKILKANIFNRDNINDEIFNEYVKLHQKAAGRQTRPLATFDMMKKWIGQDKAFLVGAKKNNKFIGFSYFFLYKNNVFYGSSCNDPEFQQLPISHFIQWSAIKLMNEKKYKFYEIGWQIYNEGMSDYSSKKRINISKFEKGLGGEVKPLFMSEKYYDKSFFLKVYNSRINQFAQTIK
ncbi:MAG: hypothetical protein WC619_00515 [Patescibacteria group bacterium]